MKNQTIANDVTKVLAVRESGLRLNRAVALVSAKLRAGADVSAHVAEAEAARVTDERNRVALSRVPSSRRLHASAVVESAERLGNLVAHLGGFYSGETRFTVEWSVSGVSSARTVTSAGANYSRRCTYRKTDARHIVALCPAGVVALVESEPLRQCSARDGLHLIDLREDGAAVWVRVKGKALVSESGWVVGNASICYHSRISRNHALEGLAKKQAAAEKAARAALADRKAARRARLVARLCGGAVATVADARAMGYCEPGIRGFQERFEVGDSAPLPELVRTGDPAAVALALSVARRLVHA